MTNLPYIKEENKVYFDAVLLPLKRCAIANGAELNYLFAELLNQFFVTNSKNYSNLAQAISALECQKLELYRRVAAPYEDSKIESNGEVYNEEVLR